MIKLKIHPGCTPKYMSKLSSACDVVSRVDMDIEAGSVGKVPTGVWIEDLTQDGKLFEIQIRARSGLSLKKISLANGVGTIDADFKDEICVLLKNDSDCTFHIKAQDRIAQMVLSEVIRFDFLPVGEQRSGGFGSTGISNK